MRFLAIEREAAAADPKRMRALLGPEAQAVWALLQADVLREIWFTEDHRAVLMLECANAEAAEAALQTLPLYREKLIDFECTALRPYDGLGRLFDKRQPRISLAK